jgi:phosphate transport system substrate-binding protein
VSDAPLTVAELDKFGLVQFPLVIGGAVPVVNLRGIGPGQLKLSGGVLADIYLGKITKWNDPAIVKLNAGIQLPDQAIAVVYRSDGSGTTYIWADYLSKVSPEWNENVGVNMALDWPTGFGGKGNEGVAAVTARTAGAIGYLEYAYAKQNKMTYALVDSRDGTFVEPKKETFQAAAANADWSKAPGFNLMLTYQSGKDSWPITGTSFVLMHKVQEKAAVGKPLLEFFDWAFAQGAEMAESLDYVPIPSGVADLVRAAWRDVKGPDQKPLWSAEAK